MKKRQTLLTALAALIISAGAAHFVEKRAAAAGASTLLETASFPEETATPEIAMASFISAPVTPLQPRIQPVPESIPVPIPVQDVRDVLIGPGVAAIAESSEGDTTLASLSDEDFTPGTLPIEGPRLPLDVATPDPLPIPAPSPAARLALTKNAIDPKPTLEEKRQVNEFGLSCGVILAAAEREGGIVNLTVTAPCRSDERITVRHDALVFTASINDLGSFSTDIPALSQTPTFEVTFADGTVTETTLEIDKAPVTDRVVLQYNGKTGLQIHALEFGAGYGEQGHVWAENPRDAALATRLGGGFLMRLGDPSLPDAFQAEVYTFSNDAADSDGVVRLNVEAEVTAANCGRDIAGQTIQADDTGALRSVSLTLSMPDCDAVGEFLVLKNLLRDLKIAAN